MADLTDSNRFACKLHDAASQTMFAAHLLAGALSRAPELDETLRQQLRTLEQLNRNALAEMRLLLLELRPEALQSMQLPELLRQAVAPLSGRGGLQTSVDLDEGPEPPLPQRLLLYRVTQETLTEIVRRSGAQHVYLAWRQPASDRGQLRITNDGHGGLIGLEQLRERAEDLGGRLQVDKTPEGGTAVELAMSWEAH